MRSAQLACFTSPQLVQWRMSGPRPACLRTVVTVTIPVRWKSDSEPKLCFMTPLDSSDRTRALFPQPVHWQHMNAGRAVAGAVWVDTRSDEELGLARGRLARAKEQIIAERKRAVLRSQSAE